MEKLKYYVSLHRGQMHGPFVFSAGNSAKLLDAHFLTHPLERGGSEVEGIRMECVFGRREEFCKYVGCHLRSWSMHYFESIFGNVAFDEVILDFDVIHTAW
jgi:hypothetical protein